MSKPCREGLRRVGGEGGPEGQEEWWDEGMGWSISGWGKRVVGMNAWSVRKKRRVWKRLVDLTHFPSFLYSYKNFNRWRP